MSRQPSRRTPTPRLAAALLLAAGVAGGCGRGGDAREARGDPLAATPTLAVHEAWIRVPAGDAAALYLTLVDVGGQGDRLLAARSDVSGTTVLHRTVREGDRVRMLRAVGGLEVPAGGELALVPGGPHFMLLELGRELRAGEHVEVELELERAGTLPVRVPVKY